MEINSHHTGQRGVCAGTHVQRLGSQPQGVDADHLSRSRIQAAQCSAAQTGQVSVTLVTPRRNSMRMSGAGAQLGAGSATGTVRLVGDWSADTIDLRGVSVLGNVVVEGASGDDRLIGGTSNDVLGGGNGNDLLVGGAGQDALDGGKGNDLLLGSQGLGSGRELLIGGAGADRFALAYNDHSAVDIRGGSLGGRDGSADLITLVGTRGALAFSATILDFELGKDRIDLSQLRDAGNNVLALDDLLVTVAGGNAQIGFAAGVHAVDGGSIDVQITLVGFSGIAASAFSFGAPTLPWGQPALETALAYL